jgi:hypothetical protein
MSPPLILYIFEYVRSILVYKFQPNQILLTMNNHDLIDPHDSG